MLRVVVAVALAVALLAVTLPALETARADRSEHRVEGEIDGLAAAIEDVYARESAAPAGSAGARRVVTLRVPAQSWTDAGIEYVAIGGRPDWSDVDDRNSTVLAWQVTGREPQERRIPDVTVAGDTGGDTGSVVIREPGIHRLSVALIERGDETAVVVRRVGDE
ncbi:DUF7311 family protein [Halorientalis salina]|uniref:DUF7311 family protein n=1 Tax=Halorientalis salina TaxID=2932266 RepID=UPI0010ACE251|nr:hypothetical protein [Halorientalis salina]